MVLFDTKTQKKQKLILDVGSSRVNCVLARYLPEEKIEIIRLFQSDGVILPEANLKALWRRVSSLIEGVVSSFKKSGLKADEALVVFSSPWYFSEVSDIKREFNEPTEITESFFESALESVSEDFKERAAGALKIRADDLSFTNLAVMSAKLNGYAIKNPEKNIFGKIVRNLSVSVYISSFFGEAARATKRLLEDCGIKSVDFRSSSQVLFETVSQLGHDNITVVDVGGEITDVIMIKDGEIKKSVSFGRGLNYVARRMGPVFKIGLEETMSLLSNYIEGKLEDSFKESVAKALREAIIEWKSMFKEVLQRHAAPEFAPSKVLVTGHGGGVTELKKILADPELSNYTPENRPFEVLERLPERVLGRFKNADYILKKPYLYLINFYLIYAAK